MKILEVVFNFYPGGAERFAVDLTNELSKSNEVTIMAIKDDSVDPERDLFYASELADRVTYKNVGIGKGYSVHKVFKIYKAIKQEKADIVHLHGDKMPHYCILAILLLHRKMKFYQTIHNDIHNGYDSLFYRFLVKTVGSLPPSPPPEGWGSKMGFVALSKTNYRDMMDVYPKIKGACINNGRAPIVPTDRFDEAREEMASYKSAADSRIYLHVARCNPVKNQRLLVEAFDKLVEKGYHADLIIIGPGFENKLGESIRAKAGTHVHFIGTRKNVGDYMLHADVFCLSSDYEGMPITLLEASLAGLPIVSTPVCGAVDIIENKVNGVLSEGHTVGEYLDALEYSYQHLCELRQHSLKMKDDSAYTIENCARKYMDFFNR